MTFQIINRRLHLYLGMFLFPWVLMYAFSSMVFNHLPAIREWDGRGNPQWTTRWERDYQLPVPAEADLRQVGRQLLEDQGLESPFFAGRPQPDTLNILLVDFWNRARVIYHLDRGKVIFQEMEPRWYQLLMGFHLRAGYRHDHFLSDLWAVTLDLVCGGFLLWIASGLYMWWTLRGSRLWGIAALAGGTGTFLFFLVAL